jgi:hypothetical protein
MADFSYCTHHHGNFKSPLIIYEAAGITSMYHSCTCMCTQMIHSLRKEVMHVGRRGGEVLSLGRLSPEHKWTYKS